MLRFDVILHPTDFSEVSAAALQVARSLAHDHGARLIVVHVAHVEVAYGTIPVTYSLTGFTEALELLRGRIDGPDLAHPVRTELRQGNPVDEIVRAAEEAHCGLIVMGSHGRSGVGRVLLGSVAEGVMRQAVCPVLIVKSSDPEAKSR